MFDRDQDKRTDGPDLLSAFVYGDSIDDMKLAALDKARELYGADVPLVIEGVGHITTSTSHRGKWCTRIAVRCQKLPEGW